MKRAINGEIEYVFVNEIHDNIVGLEDCVQSTWPDADGFKCLTNELKVIFSCLAYFISGCDVLPEIYGLPFLNECILLLKALPTTRLFQCTIIMNHAGSLAIHSRGAVRLARQ